MELKRIKNLNPSLNSIFLVRIGLAYVFEGIWDINNKYVVKGEGDFGISF